MTPNRVLVGLATAAIAAVVAVALPSGVAAAHEGQGQFAVETAEPTAAGVRYIVRLTWVGDNHPAIDATVTATPIDPAGRAGTPVAFTPVAQDGRYQGGVALPAPGTWVVRFTAVTPPATTEVTREVTAATSTVPASTSSTAPTSPLPTTGEASAASTDDSGGSAGTLVFAGVLVAIAAGGALAYPSARRRRAP